ncbi:MAG: helix-turn-helix domain-containing protein [Candidatus Omnitrophota bacterium]|nr:helix-turn-helix domain-containing protein [Candidatus Omnitrophota bacterium]
MGNAQVTEKKVSLAEIGELLRQAREKRALTIEQAQKQTRIHSTVLIALEDGRCDDILPPNYVKSFLKEYASYLGFDHQAVVAGYLSVHPELKSRGITSGASRKDESSSAGLSKIIRLIRSIVIFLTLIFLAVFISSKAVTFFKNAKSSRSSATSKYGKTLSRAKAPSGPRKSSALKNLPFTMTVKTKNPVMVQLRKDGVLLFKRVLPKGSEEIFAVKNSANIFVGRAEFIEIIVDGKSLGSPGRGVARDVEVTSNGIKIK